MAKLFTPLQRANRVDCCEELLENCAQDSTGVFGRIVTGNETWIHHHDPLSQQEAKTWKKPSERTPTRPRRITRSAARSSWPSSEIAKVFFWSIFYHVVLQSTIHITHNFFADYVLLFGRNLGVVCCFFTTTHVSTCPTSHRLLFSSQTSQNRTILHILQVLTHRLSSVLKCEEFSSWQEL